MANTQIARTAFLVKMEVSLWGVGVRLISKSRLGNCDEMYLGTKFTKSLSEQLEIRHLQTQTLRQYRGFSGYTG